MGFGRGFTFILGSLFGVYVAQHYRVPRIGDWAHSGCVKARELEQAYRRPENFNPNKGHRAHELEQAYRRPNHFNPNEDNWAHDCWFRPKYHERTYNRPENFYGNEAGEEQNNEVVHPNLSRPKTLDPNEANEEKYNNKAFHQERARPMDPSWARPRDLINKPYDNNGPENFNPNEGGQE